MTSSSSIRDDHPAGIRRAFAIAAVAALAAVVPYFVPGWDELQVVGPEDELPFHGLLEGAPASGASLAGAMRRRGSVDHDDRALMEAAPLPEAVAVTPRPSPPPSTRPRDPRQAPLARIDPEEYEGLTREIEDPTGRGLRPFYQALARVARRERGAMARIGVYGTSIDGADRATSLLRSRLQARYGDGGKGWVPVSPGWRYQSHRDIEWSSEHWRTYVINRRNAPLDRFGFGGVVAENRNARAVARFATVGGNEGPGRAVSRFRVFYQAFPEGGSFSVRVDDGRARTVSARSDEVEDRVEEVLAPDGPHRLTLRAVGGEDGAGVADLRLYGVTMERDGPGVVVDGLALIGAFTRVLRYWDEAHLTAQVQAREPDLLVFWMGANDAASRSVAFIPDQYIRRYRRVLRRFRRARPAMGCMVMSILDKGERVGSQIRTRARVPNLVDAQREAAEAEGCAFFDSYRAVGGDGTMRRWYQSSPRLVTADLGHLTESGSRVVGTLIYRALMKGFDDWIAEGEPGVED